METIQSAPTPSTPTTPLYVREGAAEFRPLADHEVLDVASSILLAQIRQGPLLTSASVVGHFLQCKMGMQPVEVFAVLYLDTQNRLLAFREVFRGTLNSSVVHPREIARQALELGAANIIVAHNHPSGNGAPSDSDMTVTRQLSEALALLDIKLLDHFIVTYDATVSFRARGYL
jgi:DNA repair protein RadC